MKAKIILIVVIALALTACTTTTPPVSCTARVRVDVLNSIPSDVNKPEVIDWLDQDQSALVQSQESGWYEVVTPKLVRGYVDVSVCE
jgi:hypothetical protein